MSISPRPQRQPAIDVLAVIDGLGGVEVYGERINVRIVHVPVAEHRSGEAMAEEVAYSRLPLRWRRLWRADWLRATAATRPMTVSSLAAAQATHDALVALDRLAEEGGRA